MGAEQRWLQFGMGRSFLTLVTEAHYNQWLIMCMLASYVCHASAHAVMPWPVQTSRIVWSQTYGSDTRRISRVCIARSSCSTFKVTICMKGCPAWCTLASLYWVLSIYGPEKSWPTLIHQSHLQNLYCFINDVLRRPVQYAHVCVDLSWNAHKKQLQTLVCKPRLCRRDAPLN